MKKYVFLILLHVSIIAFSQASQHVFEGFNIDHYTHHYNSLLDSEESGSALQKNGNLNNLIIESKDMVEKKYPEIKQYFGFRLLHKHHSLKDGEVMVEEIRRDENSEYSITYPSENLTNIFPASWMVSTNNTLTFFEFSKDSKVQEGYEKIVKYPSFMEDVYSIIKKYSLERLIAPALLARNYIEAYKHKVFIEVSHGESRTSIITPRDPKNSDTIEKTPLQTSWSFNIENFQVCCCGVSTGW